MDAVYVDFLSKLVATLIGALVGILGGFWLDRRQLASKQKKEGKTILEALRDELSHDSKLLDQMCKELPNQVIFYNLDLSTWQATTGKQLESLRNYQLVKRISGLYYEFQHLTRKVDVQFEMAYSTTRAFTDYATLRREIVGAIVNHVAVLQPQLVKLISDIDFEIVKL